MPMPLSFMNRFKPYFISSLIGEQVMTCDSEKKNGSGTADHDGKQAI